MIRKAFISIILLFIGFINSLKANDCYSEYWQKLYWEMWQQSNFAVGTYLKLESGDHFKKIRSLQISEQFTYQLSKNFSSEHHYTYIHGHSVVPHSLWE
jgi:hypothetical protein